MEKTRANTRRFFKVETFEELIFTDDCNERKDRPGGPNFVYPITGTVGLKNVVDDFVKLTTRGAQSKGGGDIPNFSEQLQFATTLRGAVHPGVTIEPIKDVFKLTAARADFSAARTDLHELTVTFALEKGLDPRSLVAKAPSSRKAVIDELNKLRALDAAERGGGIFVP